MKKEENVYGETTLTEKGAEAQEERENSTVLGKFKDVNALVQAYGALEAEFTRRSQRLKELEKEVENLSKKPTDGLGVEKLRKSATLRRAEEKKFDEYVQSLGEEYAAKNAEPTFTFAPENASEPIDEGEEAEETGEYEERKERKERETPVESKGGTSSDTVYAQAIGDENVRLKIIGEYLTSIGKSGAPITFNGGGVLRTPPAKVKSIVAAGDLALEYFKKGAREL